MFSRLNQPILWSPFTIFSLWFSHAAYRPRLFFPLAARNILSVLTTGVATLSINFYALLLQILSSKFLHHDLFCWPSSIRSDGGPQFRGDFSHFCEKHGIRHELSAPYNPKSNGLAEAGVKSVKNILRKSLSSGSDADFMLYECRNVPRSDDYSPTQLMFGRA